MNWRLASRLSVITFAALVVLVIALIQQQKAQVQPNSSNNAIPTTASGLYGTDLGGKVAPGFQLTDQNGKQISLAQFKGEPVVLTFLYTHCPDVCPLTAEKLHSTVQLLGSNAQHVGIIAVSVDPKGDTPAAVTAFTQAHNMQNSWHYLMGSQAELSPVWSNYSIYAQTMTQTTSHSDAIYVIDKQGRERVFLSSNDFQPSDLATDLKTLLKENG
jgi:protein SCO1/2